MSALRLTDQASGRTVAVKAAQLRQACGLCGTQMKGSLVASVEGDRDGWTCLGHLERRLSRLGPTERKLAEMKTREQLLALQPGDEVTVTRTMLVALDAV